MSEPRTALITGASRGIGLAIAERLSASGYRLALTARDAERLAEVGRQLPGEALAVPADLRDPAAPAAIVREAEARLGPLGVLINNAGTAPSAKLERTTDAMLDEVLDLHVKAPFRLIRCLLPSMTERGAGRLIQLASTAGLRGYPLVTAYTAAKHAMVGLTRALAAEVAATGIRVFAVCPGFVDTDITRRGAAAVAERGQHTERQVLEMYAAMNACGRLLQPAEVAELVAELADPSCEAATGAIYEMDRMPPVALQ